ncbi:MAG TPA: hypothetical protein VN747_02690 [Burkholderiales bacterium]|nr:hypothetical protein [Burkholderiales bacterium]
MKRILLAAALVAVSTSVFADPDKWRSPYLGAPGGTPVSPLDAEKQAPVEKRELDAWRTTGHHWHLPGFRTAEAPARR